MPTITLTPVTLNSSITFVALSSSTSDPTFGRLKRDYADYAALKAAFATFALLKASS